MMTATQARWETRNSFRVLLSDNGDTIYALSEDDNVTDAQMREIANAMQDMERSGESLWTMAQAARRIADACIAENNAERQLEGAVRRIEERRAEPEDYMEAARWIREATDRAAHGTETEYDGEMMSRITAVLDREATA